MSRPPYRRHNLALFLILGTLLASSLACISLDLTYTVLPREDGSADLKLTFEEYLTEAYIQAAKQANEDLRQDFIDAGETPPESIFPTTWTQIENMSESGTSLPDPDMVITTRDDRGYRAEITYPAGETPDMNFTLTTGEVDKDGNAIYTFRLQSPSTADDESSYLDMVKQIEAPLPPKPPFAKAEESDTDAEATGTPLDFLLAFSDIGTSLGNMQPELLGWYLQRILKETGMPVLKYRIEMPGRITSHTVNGETAGTLSDDHRSAIFVMDAAFFRKWGEGALDLVVTSAVNPCEVICASSPHSIWDQSDADSDSCTCICEVGFESDVNGVCLDCDQVCNTSDPLVEYDPFTTTPNHCGCACTGALMDFVRTAEGGKCECVAGAQRVGDTCECQEGYALSLDGTTCEKQTSGKPEENCPEGTNCLLSPGKCTCADPKVCDPLATGTDPATGCADKRAYVFIASDITKYQYYWLVPKIWNVRRYFTNKGYITEVIYIKNDDDLLTYLSRPSTKAVAYFGHGIEPSMESMNAGTLGNSVNDSLRKQYQALGIPRAEAMSLSNARPNLGVDYAYMHTCFSATSMRLRDYLVKSGGTYWGHDRLLYPVQPLTEYKRP